MKTVREVSKLTGVSVRTLHHYDSIGLLPPTQVTQAGYRLYDDAALIRLQTILLFRELQFPLKEIKAILDRPDFDPAEALRRQIELLELQKLRLDRLLFLARSIEKKGFDTMDFHAFDNTQLEEARSRWGHTAAYQEFEQRGQRHGGEQMMAFFAQLGTQKHLPPSDEAVQATIRDLRDFITVHYYTCTNEILHGLGAMYVQDERFRRNIDNAGGEGTAAFAKAAIDHFCK